MEEKNWFKGLLSRYNILFPRQLKKPTERTEPFKVAVLESSCHHSHWVWLKLKLGRQSRGADTQASQEGSFSAGAEVSDSLWGAPGDWDSGLGGQLLVLGAGVPKGEAVMKPVLLALGECCIQTVFRCCCRNELFLPEWSSKARVKLTGTRSWACQRKWQEASRRDWVHPSSCSLEISQLLAKPTEKSRLRAKMLCRVPAQLDEGLLFLVHR